MGDLELVKTYHKEAKKLLAQGYNQYDIRDRLNLPPSLWCWLAEDQNGHLSLTFGSGIYHSDCHKIYQEISED